jgi:hypothetical protein
MTNPAYTGFAALAKRKSAICQVEGLRSLKICFSNSKTDLESLLARTRNPFGY